MGVMEFAGESEFIEVLTKKLAPYALHKLFIDLSPCSSKFHLQFIRYSTTLSGTVIGNNRGVGVQKGRLVVRV
jgi:hypothetical protein